MSSKIEENLHQGAVQELHTVNDWVRWSATQMNKADVFFGHGTDNAWDESAQLIFWVLGIPWDRAEQYLNARLTIDERNAVLELLNKRIEQRLPVPYITGESLFYGMLFYVNEHVLIPRSPIAELIDARFQPWLASEPKRILDLCAGSGCIGITCASVFDSAEVVLSDISQAALNIAQKNILRHDSDTQIVTIQSDAFARLVSQRFDLIVCNPPYVGAQEMAQLPEEYRAEPELALASGQDGLDLVRRILVQASQHLTDNGILVLEVGNSWSAMEDAFPNVPFIWLDFERGGYGVTVLNKEQLDRYFTVP